MQATTLSADAGTEVNCQVAKGKEATVNSRRRFQSGSLFKRGRRRKVWVGRWWEDTLMPDGTLGRMRKAVVLGPVSDIPTRVEAKKRLEERLRAINQGTFRPQSQLTFREFALEQFEPAMLPTLKFSTQRNYRHFLRRHFLPAFGDQRLCDLQTVELQRFVIDKFQQGFSWQTAAHLKNTMSKILSTAVSWGYLQENPARGVKLPPKQLKPERKFLTPDQVRRLLAVLPEPMRTMVLVAVLAGLRAGELLALHWKNVDLLRSTIRVQESVYEGNFSTPKTRSSIRSIPASKAVVQSLVAHRTRCGGGDPESLVFATKCGTAYSAKNLHRRVLLPACDAAGIPRVGWHSLRHTCATLMHELGESIKTAQALLGHSSLQTTLEVYTHAVPETQRAAVERLEHLLLGGQLDPNGPKFPVLEEAGSRRVQ